MFAVNRPQPGAPDVRLEILTRTIERYLQLWNEAYERANVWPLPRGTLGGRLVGRDEGAVGSYPSGDGCQGRGDL